MRRRFVVLALVFVATSAAVAAQLRKVNGDGISTCHAYDKLVERTLRDTKASE